MKLKLLAMVAVLTAPFTSFAQQPAKASVSEESFPPMVLTNTELRPLHSKVTGRDYLLYIGYPDSYKDHPDRKYPVVYVTDGYWAFTKMYSLGSSLWYDQIVPEYIVVGIGYQGQNVNYDKERQYELTPVVWHQEQRPGVRMGGSRAFLDAIKSEIIPYVEKSTRADSSFRVLAGTSLGGLFCLYSMYEEPELFQGIICSAPAVIWGDRWLFSREMQLSMKAGGHENKTTLRIPTRLFMCAADQEWPVFDGDILAFDQIIKHANYRDFSYEFRMIDGERHGGNVAEAYNRGLRFVFMPMMPSPVMP